MRLELKEYDLRRFSMKDAKDVLSYLDTMEKFIPMMKTQIKKLGQENSAKASIIRSLERRIEKLGDRQALAPEAINGDDLIQSAVPEAIDFDKDKFIEMMQESRDAQTGLQNALEEAKKDEEVLEPILDVKDDSEGTESLNTATSEGYSYKLSKAGKDMWRYNGKLCSRKDVPEHVIKDLKG